MATQLRNIVRFVAIAPATPTSQAHDLNLDDIGLLPDLLIQSRGDFTVTADATNVTVTNNGGSAASIDAFVVHWHTFDRVFGSDAVTALTPAPFIVVGNIAGGAQLDVQQTFTKSQTVAEATLTPGATVAVDASRSNNFGLVMDQDCLLANPTNVVVGMTINFNMRQDGAGSHTQTFGTAYNFDSNAPALPTGSGEKYLISCYVSAAAAGVATEMLCSRTGAQT